MTDWMKPGNTAVITGGASGIGFAAAERFVAAGMNVMLADLDEAALAGAAQSLGQVEGGGAVHTQVCDVSDFAQVQALQSAVTQSLGAVHYLMNNAGAALPPAAPWEGLDRWKKQIDINLWGIIHGCQAFIPAMLEGDEHGVIINTGSKQGITNPPGGYA